MDDRKFKSILWILFALFSQTSAQYNPPFYNPNEENALSTAMARLENLLRNDELECLPRLFCEYAAGGTPGQARAVNIDIKSLFTLLQYLGLDQSNTASPMLSLAKAASLGVSYRGDSYECYRSYPRCPRDQSRLLYYLNNHRGGFFRGFRGYYHRNADEKYKNNKAGDSESRIVNNKFVNNVANINFPPYAADEIYAVTEDGYYNKPEFVFSNDHRGPKALGFSQQSDRLPNRMYFPGSDAHQGFGFGDGHPNNDIGFSFFPQA